MVTFSGFGVLPLLGVTLSQVNPTGLVVATAVNGSGLFGSVLVTETVTLVAAAPTKSVTLMDGCPTFRRAVLLTFSVTGITSGGVLDPGTDKVTFPLQTCGVRPVVLTETTTWFRTCGGGENVLPLDWAADRKPAQLEAFTATE